jgi:hypothetical protein
MIDKFMVRGSHGPMQWMLDLRTYGLKIHYNTTSRGHVEWMGQNELLYKDLHFSMAQFCGMVHGLASESRRLLTEELLFSSKAALVPAVPWGSMRDNPTDERPGCNFLKDHRTYFSLAGLFKMARKAAGLISHSLTTSDVRGVLEVCAASSRMSSVRDTQEM